MPVPTQGYFNLARFVAEKYSETSELRCLTIYIPDGDEYAAQLLALMNVAGQKPSWFSATDEERAVRAEMWQRAYRETLECIMCGCFDCDDVLNCIETNQAVRDAISAIAGTSSGTPPGVGTQTPERIAENFAAATNPECDFDILWSQCLGMVQYTNRKITDVLEQFEVDTAIIEIANILQNFPVVALAAEGFGVEFVTQLLNFMQELVAEGYAAAYTEAVEIELACDLFCLCADDCVLSIARLADVMEDRLALAAAPDLGGMISAMTAATIVGANVVDYAFWFAWTGAQTMNALFLEPFNDYVKVIMALQADEPDNDWEIHCSECVGLWEHVFDFTATNGGFTAQMVDGLTAGTYYATIGWVGNAAAIPSNPVNSRGDIVLHKPIISAGGIIREVGLNVQWDTVPSFRIAPNVRHSNGALYYRITGYDSTHVEGYMPGSYSFNSENPVDDVTENLPQGISPGNIVVEVPYYFFTSPSGAQCIVTQLILKGTGNDPFA